MFPARRHPFLASFFHLALLAVVVGVSVADFPAIVSKNSEAFAAVFLVSAPLQYLRVDQRTTLGLIWAILMVAGLALTGPFSGHLGLPSSVATHQEAFAAAAILTAYMMYPRGWLDRGHHPGSWPLYVVMGAAYGVGLLGIGGEAIDDYAETIALVLLISFYLDRIVVRSPFIRALWAGLVVMAPVVYTTLNRHGTDISAATDQWEIALVWLQRTTEGFVGVFLLQVYIEAASLWSIAQKRRTGEVDPHASSFLA